MKLHRYMKRAKLSDAEFAHQIGTSRQAVYNYRMGLRVPKRKIMMRILQASGGKVRYDDFLDGFGEQDEREPAAA